METVREPVLLVGVHFDRRSRVGRPKRITLAR
jgi:hypothetical protein